MVFLTTLVEVTLNLRKTVFCKFPLTFPSNVSPLSMKRVYVDVLSDEKGGLICVDFYTVFDC